MISTNDLLSRLNQLDAARAAGTPGTWATYWGDHIGSNVTVTGPGSVTLDHDVCEMQDVDDRACTDNEPNPASVADDATLIVTAVNAVPQLTGALRAVLKLHVSAVEELSDELAPVCLSCIDENCRPQRWPCLTVTAITTALGGQQDDTSGGRA